MKILRGLAWTILILVGWAAATAFCFGILFGILSMVGAIVTPLTLIQAGILGGVIVGALFFVLFDRR